MPPVRKTVRVQQIFDGKEEIDLRPMGVNLLYFPKFLDNKDASSIFRALMLSKAFTQHQYINRFKKQITPHRLTHAHVPKDRRYRFLGQNLNRSENEIFVQHFDQLVDRVPYTRIKPNSSVSNAYRYNNEDYIAPHTDDEKFLKSNNSELWTDSTVYTFTLLNDNDNPMLYHFANPKQEGSKIDGFELHARHGSLIIQGSVLHTVLKKSGNGSVGRISITLRTLHSECSCKKSQGKCQKITCPVNSGPSNYLYYSNKSALSKPKIKAVFKVKPI